MSGLLSSKALATVDDRHIASAILETRMACARNFALIIFPPFVDAGNATRAQAIRPVIAGSENNGTVAKFLANF
jgi:hypothetical protein